MADLRRDLDAYATLAARLADQGADRGALLAQHGLDEDGWEALDDAWQARIFAPEEDGDDGIPPLIAAYSDAFARAQRARSGREVTFERFVDATLALREGTEMTVVLARLGVTLDEFLAAQMHWTEAMLADDELAARFTRAMEQRGRQS
jgi:hypothetical protein